MKWWCDERGVLLFLEFHRQLQIGKLRIHGPTAGAEILNFHIHVGRRRQSTSQLLLLWCVHHPVFATQINILKHAFQSQILPKIVTVLQGVAAVVDPIVQEGLQPLFIQGFL
jgi:hypothetical protein